MDQGKSASKPRGKRTNLIEEEIREAKGDALFPIVGIGASAGGFEALEEFLSGVPEESGMAFVIVQHFDPARKALMAELLQRCTPMKVAQVRDRVRIKRDHVYVIPPNKDMSILHGALHLFKPVDPRGLHHPIDFFLTSLARDRVENAIGIVLSGMGSDGTEGLREIRDCSGLSLAQEPASAKFDSMPRNGIHAGVVDIVAPAGDLARRILEFIDRKPIADTDGNPADSKIRGGIEKILILLRAHANHDFSFYKMNTLCRRIERRMGIHRITKVNSYVRYLQENPNEVGLLFKEMLIGVTSFFRDPAVWEQLRTKTVPDLLAKQEGDSMRAWVAGCSTGEEAYSLAMVFQEVVGKMKPSRDLKLQIFASDLDRDAIDKARQGIYPESIVNSISPERLGKFFTSENGGYRICKEIREMVIFSPHSLIMDPPFTKLDFLSCRNLLIYLTQEMQKKLFPLFHYCLNPGGLLILGSAETIGSFGALFETVDAKARIFRRSGVHPRTDNLEFPSSYGKITEYPATSTPPTKTMRNLQTLAEQLVVHRFSPPSVLTNPDGDILHISGRTGNYLEPAAGKANWNIFAMARDGLRHELPSAFRKAMDTLGPAQLRGVTMETGRTVDVTIEKMPDTEPLGGMVIIVFIDVPPKPESKRIGKTKHGEGPRVRELEADLKQARAELITVREEVQSYHEELRSTNEEMQSTNEEMQSTNEELTTSKEELQSLNEELQTVNAELKEKVEELTGANNDMKNLLNCTEVATLFLDSALRVRRFTVPATKIINLIPGDIGRPITDLSSDLIYPDMPDDAREVLQKLGSSEKPVQTRDDRWFSIRIMPYRTIDDRIEGVVITFWDITVAKTLEATLRDQQNDLEHRVDRQNKEICDLKSTTKKSPRS